jgi:hypothetical protein
MFNEDNSSLTDFEKALSSKCQKEYPKFINELDLKDEQGNSLTLNINGTKSGTYYEWLLNKYEAGFEDYVSNYETDYQGYSTEKGNGIDFLNNFDFITYDQQTKKAKMVTPKGFDSSLDALVKEYRPRQKNCPAFDSLVPQGTDNDVFGPLGPAAGTVDGARHFNTRLAEMIKELENEYPNEYSSYYQDYFTQSNEEEVKEWVKYLNPYSFLTSSLSSNVSPNFRINMGVHDADTSICISATLGLLLEKKGINTQFNILWDWGHNDCDTPTGLLNWVNSLS